MRLARHRRPPSVPSPARRYADPDALYQQDETLVENKLVHDPAETAEWLIHGKFGRGDHDANGKFGAWYCNMDFLVDQLGEEDADKALELWEERLAAVRREAIALARAARARDAELGGGQ